MDFDTKKGSKQSIGGTSGFAECCPFVCFSGVGPGSAWARRPSLNMWTGTGAHGAPGACAAERVGQERDSGRGNVTTPRKFPSCPTVRHIPFWGSFLDAKNCIVMGNRIVRLSLRALCAVPSWLCWNSLWAQRRSRVPGQVGSIIPCLAVVERLPGTDWWQSVLPTLWST